MNGVFKAMKAEGLPSEAIDSLKDAVDCNLYFFDNKVSVSVMYVILCLTIVLLITIYVLMNVFLQKKRK